MESSEAERGRAPATPSSENPERLRKKESLQLSRTRVLNDLASCRSERYRAVLEAGLAHLDREIQSLG
jgi:hypothetical protein